MAPSDVVALVRITLTPAQFTAWHSEYMVKCRHQVDENVRTGNPVTLDLPVRLGHYTRLDQQAHVDPQTFPQCSSAALWAFKAVPEAKPRSLGSSINIRQAANEVYSDFVDRLQEAIQRQMENQDVADAL